ncbi:MAG: S-layer homology domain-containing protein, partial [Clostridia bacterium]|nr:S-layer homology domain-containing protein [Clostridia bacterium]
AILFRLSGGEENMEFTFTDVPDDAWYKKYVGWAESAGVITGYGNAETFGGNELITREQLMLMTSRYMKYEWIQFPDSDSAVDFTDKAKISSWAADGVEVTRKAGLVTGDNGGNFNPQNNATRAEIATIVVRYADKLSTALDPMHMKLDHFLELVEVEGKNPVLRFGKDMDVRQNRADVIGEQFLPQMGLDTEKYEMVMDENTYRNFRSSYQPYVFLGKMEVGEYKSVLTKIVIRNKETGETTKSVTYQCKLYYIDRIIDPATYDVDLPADVQAQMNDTSVASLGNVSRLASVFARAEKGEKITAAYIGGSLTQAGTADKNGNWASGTSAWLERKFPKAEIVHVNAGWGGTNSDFGAVRMEDNVLMYDPDIVFIEFTTNDPNGSDYYKQSMESLVRRALEHGDDTAVIIVLAGNANPYEGMLDSREMNCDLAEYYGLPVIDFNAGLHVGIDAGLYDYDIISVDGDHLNTWGYQAELDMVEYMFEKICDKISTSSASELKIPAIPEKLFAPGDRFMDLVTINPNMNENLITSFGSWKRWETSDDGELLRVGYTCSGLNGNDPLKFTFAGSDLYIPLYSTETVNLKITLDDGAGHKYEYLYGAETNKPYRVNSEPLVKSTYNVTITVDNPTAGEDVVFFGITYR